MALTCAEYRLKSEFSVTNDLVIAELMLLIPWWCIVVILCCVKVQISSHLNFNFFIFWFLCYFSHPPFPPTYSYSFLPFKVFLWSFTSFPLGLCFRKMNDLYVMYDPAGESTAKKTLTLLNENLRDYRPQNRECQASHYTLWGFGLVGVVSSLLNLPWP